MKLDLYTKAVLTVIALCLVWICLRDTAVVPPAQAAASPVFDQVYIAGVAPDVVVPVRVVSQK